MGRALACRLKGELILKLFSIILVCISLLLGGTPHRATCGPVAGATGCGAASGPARMMAMMPCCQGGRAMRRCIRSAGMNMRSSPCGQPTSPGKRSVPPCQLLSSGNLCLVAISYCAGPDRGLGQILPPWAFSQPVLPHISSHVDCALPVGISPAILRVPAAHHLILII